MDQNYHPLLLQILQGSALQLPAACRGHRAPALRCRTQVSAFDDGVESCDQVSIADHRGMRWHERPVLLSMRNGDTKLTPNTKVSKWISGPVASVHRGTDSAKYLDANMTAAVLASARLGQEMGKIHPVRWPHYRKGANGGEFTCTGSVTAADYSDAVSAAFNATAQSKTAVAEYNLVQARVRGQSFAIYETSTTFPKIFVEKSIYALIKDAKVQPCISYVDVEDIKDIEAPTDDAKIAAYNTEYDQTRSALAGPASAKPPPGGGGGGSTEEPTDKVDGKNAAKAFNQFKNKPGEFINNNNLPTATLAYVVKHMKVYKPEDKAGEPDKTEFPADLKPLENLRDIDKKNYSHEQAIERMRKIVENPGAPKPNDTVFSAQEALHYYFVENVDGYKEAVSNDTGKGYVELLFAAVAMFQFMACCGVDIQVPEVEDAK